MGNLLNRWPIRIAFAVKLLFDLKLDSKLALSTQVCLNEFGSSQTTISLFFI